MLEAVAFSLLVRALASSAGDRNSKPRSERGEVWTGYSWCRNPDGSEVSGVSVTDIGK